MLFIRRHFFSSVSRDIKAQMDASSNITQHILNCSEKQLYKIPQHPLGILKSSIESYFQPQDFKTLDSLNPVVDVKKNFDELMVPADHPSRKISESYYLTESKMLRPHTSVHQIDTLRQGIERFCIYGDVYRRDTIDRTHYPVFHQMETVKLFENERDDQVILEDLKQTMEGLVDHLFGKVEKRWVEAYFPFTDPSLELEIYFKDDWLEVLGCGVIHKGVLNNAQVTKKGWAAGLGLERFGMLLFNIPDIRLFWSEDPRFINQFSDRQIKDFKPFSKYPSCYKDISFFIPETFEENDFYEQVRNQGGDLIEEVQLIDEFFNKKLNKTSQCYRIHYRSLERTLQNEEIDTIQFKIRENVQEKLKLQLR